MARRLRFGNQTLLLLVAALTPLAGCGSSNSATDRHARIAVALRRYEREVIAGKRKGEQELRGKDVLGILTLNYAPPPHGVSKAEWGAAIKHDKRIQRLEADEEASPSPPRVALGRQSAAYEAGKHAVAQTGCLACHRIGDNGNVGPGKALTHVGARLTPAAIERALNSPRSPMPSFRLLPPDRFHAIVTFLSELR